MDEKVYFQTKITLDLDFDRECTRFQRLTSRFELIRHLGICAILYVIYTSNYKHSDFLTLGYIIGIVISHVVTWLRLRNGTAWYKETLEKNGGQPVCNIISFLDANIIRVNPKTTNITVHDYSHYSHYTQTRRCLLLFGTGEQPLMVDKAELVGGTGEALVDFIHCRCPKLQKKLLSETVGMVLAAAYVCTLAVFLVLAIFA